MAKRTIVVGINQTTMCALSMVTIAALVDAEIRVLNAYPHPSELDWRRLRHAQHRVTCQMAAWLALAERTANRRAA